MFALQDLMAMFAGRESFAWQILYSEIALHNSAALHTDHIKTLIELYSIGMQKLNQLSQEPSNYFKSKINELMGQKRVIRCLNDHKDQKENHRAQQQELQARKRELEIRLAYDIESNNDRLRTIINQQNAREHELQRIVKTILTTEQQKLDQKIKQRHSRIQSNKTIRREHKSTAQDTDLTDTSNSPQHSISADLPPSPFDVV